MSDRIYTNADGQAFIRSDSGYVIPLYSATNGVAIPDTSTAIAAALADPDSAISQAVLALVGGGGGGGGAFLPYQPNRTYDLTRTTPMYMTSGPLSTSTIAANKLITLPWILETDIAVNRFVLSRTASTGGASISMALLNDVDGRGNSVFANIGQAATSAVTPGSVSESAFDGSWEIPAGVYHVALTTNDSGLIVTGGSPTMNTYGAFAGAFIYDRTYENPITGLSTEQAFDEDNQMVYTNTHINIPRVIFRVAS